MIDNPLLLIDLKNSYMSSSGKLICNVCFSFDNYVYPSKTWNDFVEIILNWWLIELSQKKKQYVFCFMDGPYQLTAKKIDDKLIRISFDNGYSIICDERKFVKCIIDAAYNLLDNYIRTGYIQKSIDVLRNNIVNAKNKLD